jgi:RNA polymerase sigma-70 factor (ECF subfamily)
VEPRELERAFLAGLAEPVESSGGGLGERLSAMIERARAACPAASVDAAAFAGFLAERLPGGADAMSALDAIKVEDLYLAFACGQGDAAAMAELERSHMPELGRALARLRLTATEIDEAVQVVRELLLLPGVSGRPAVLEYAGLGALSRWLRVVGVREALRLVRRTRREAAGADDDLLFEAAAPGDDPQVAYFKQTYRADFKAAFGDALASLSARDRNLLRYHYVDSLNIAAIGVIFRVHRATVARWLIQVRTALLGETRRLLGERLQLSSGEIESVLRLIESQLDLSLPRLLAGPR